MVNIGNFVLIDSPLNYLRERRKMIDKYNSGELDDGSEISKGLEKIIFLIPSNAIVFYHEADRNRKLKEGLESFGEHTIQTIEMIYHEGFRRGPQLFAWASIRCQYTEIGAKKDEPLYSLGGFSRLNNFDDETESWGPSRFFLKSEDYLRFKEIILEFKHFFHDEAVSVV